MIKLITHPRSFSLEGTVLDALAAPSTGSRENSAWIVSVAPGTEGVPHSVTREEIFVALEGAATVSSAGEVHELRAGAAMIVPAHATFALSNRTEQTFRAVAVLPVGGQAVMPGGATISPPWTQ